MMLSSFEECIFGLGCTFPCTNRRETTSWHLSNPTNVYEKDLWSSSNESDDVCTPPSALPPRKPVLCDHLLTYTFISVTPIASAIVFSLPSPIFLSSCLFLACCLVNQGRPSLQLPNKDSLTFVPAAVAVSSKILTRRRKNRDSYEWTAELTKKLVNGINLYGAGSWNLILSLGFPSWVTGMKLKDKWRNLVKFVHVRKTTTGKWIIL